MRKVIYSDELPENLILQAGSLFTLVDSDRMIKQAASSAISEKLMREHKPDKDHFAAHLIAMGADEYYSFNRNGDGFPEKMLKRDHPTFVSHGHFFREHRNHDPKLKIGDIKAAAYNDPMHRVELIVWGHKKLAEEEYEMVKAGKEMSYSMSIRVPYDQCSCCDNKAKRSSLYCSHLRDHMTQYLPQFKKFAYAVNPKGTFFDISKVKNRADRIAAFLQYNLGEEALDKAASVSPRFIFSDEWAEHEGVWIPDEEQGLAGSEASNMLAKLAEAETYIEQALQNQVPHDRRYQFFKEAVQRAFRPDAICAEDFQKLAALPPDQVFDGLAQRGATLPFIPFSAYSLRLSLEDAANDPVVKAAQQHLPRIFRTLQVVPSNPEREQLYQSLTSKQAACCCTDPVDQLLDKVSQGMAVAGTPAKQRIIRITITSGQVLPPLPFRVKFAERLTSEQDRKSKTLAQLYGMYKVAACLAMEQDPNKKYLVDESTSLLINYQHLI